VKTVIQHILISLHSGTGGSIFLFFGMNKRKVHILPTQTTPEIILDPVGVITIKGRSLELNKTNVPSEITDWIEGYMKNPAELTEVIISFEYLNSYGTKVLVSILQSISKVIHQNKKFVIHWYYDEDDEDILKRGEYVSSALGLPIEFLTNIDS